MHSKPLAVGSHHARGLLSAMLERVQAEIGKLLRLRMGMNGHHPALFSKFIERKHLQSARTRSRCLVRSELWSLPRLDRLAEFHDVGKMASIVFHPEFEEPPQIDGPDALHLGFPLQIQTQASLEPLDTDAA